MNKPYIPLPKAFVCRIHREFPQEASLLLEALDGPQSWGMRINPLRKDARILSERLSDKIDHVPWCSEGYYYDGERIHPGRHPYHNAGLYYLQDPSAMAVAEVLDVVPGQMVLDLCAAPGGKATAIASKLAGKGLLVANEYVRNRAPLLSSNLERWGVTNGMVTSAHPDRLAEIWGEGFDRVLVDAPCSGEGMFRKDPATRQAWTPAAADACPGRQKLLLSSAARLVRRGGRLVYSTCTFSPAENEDIVCWFLDTHPDYAPYSFSIPGWRPGKNGETYCARMAPHIGRGEGHFVAAFLRIEGSSPSIARKKLPPCKDAKTWKAFWDEMGGAPLPGQLVQEGDCFHLYPDILLETHGITCLRAGIPLGRAGKGYFVPHHSLAMTGLVRSQFPLDFGAGQADAYLAGEVLPCSGKGWMVASLDGAPLGWGKASQGQLKNHLPAGLRRCSISKWEEEPI